jgi:hypothetical protein
MKKLKHKQEQEELNRLWLEESADGISIDTPRPEPSKESNTPKSKASLLTKTKSMSNFGSFFNLGGKKRSKKKE